MFSVGEEEGWSLSTGSRRSRLLEPRGGEMRSRVSLSLICSVCLVRQAAKGTRSLVFSFSLSYYHRFAENGPKTAAGRRTNKLLLFDAYDTLTPPCQVEI